MRVGARRVRGDLERRGCGRATEAQSSMSAINVGSALRRLRDTAAIRLLNPDPIN